MSNVLLSPKESEKNRIRSQLVLNSQSIIAPVPEVTANTNEVKVDTEYFQSQGQNSQSSAAEPVKEEVIKAHLASHQQEIQQRK